MLYWSFNRFAFLKIINLEVLRYLYKLLDLLTYFHSLEGFSSSHLLFYAQKPRYISKYLMLWFKNMLDCSYGSRWVDKISDKPIKIISKPALPYQYFGDSPKAGESYALMGYLSLPFHIIFFLICRDKKKNQLEVDLIFPSIFKC